MVTMRKGEKQLVVHQIFSEVTYTNTELSFSQLMYFTFYANVKQWKLSWFAGGKKDM
jgi:hypothetical protein